MVVNSSQAGFELLQTDRLDVFLALELDALCFGGYGMAVQQLAMAAIGTICPDLHKTPHHPDYLGGVQWAANPDEVPKTVAIPPEIFDAPSRLLLARLQLALEHGTELTEEKVTRACIYGKPC